MLRNATELRVQPSAEGMQRALLFPYEARLASRFTNSFLAQDMRASRNHMSQELLSTWTVLEGAMELMIEGEWMPLDRRQSLRFPADRRHGYRNRTAHDVVLHDIIHYASPPKLG